ncbi:hypothetical protein [Hyphomonas sp.]|jgi:hypothetical protein|uniref:hypothetical protein n=1 Tax=Hyphomonas sp. TaxID=87 RepID=UPI0025BE0344|nr:hypothetical protein [Hyphomonas sp.]
MRRVKLLLVGILAASACTSLSEKPDLMAAQAADGTPCFTDRDAYFSMDYWTFDQAPDGLRSVSAKPGCELAAADLIRDYHAALRARGEPVSHAFPQGEVQFSEDGEIPLLYWHEGQIRAMHGQPQEALDLFNKSIKPEEQSIGGWNEYVRATIAFVEGNRSALEAERANLVAKVPADNLNLGVVDGLIVCFGRSYADAYGAPECNRRPQRSP